MFRAPIDFEDVDLTKYLGDLSVKNRTMSNIFRLNFKDVVGAVVSAVLMAVLGYITSLASVYATDWHKVMGIALMTACVSLLKSLMSDNDGYLLGVMKVK